MLVIGREGGVLAATFAAQKKLPLYLISEQTFADGEGAVDLQHLQLQPDTLCILIFDWLAVGTAAINREYLFLLVLLQKLHEQGARRLMLMLPYLPYARQQQGTGVLHLLSNQLAAFDYVQVATVDVHDEGLLLPLVLRKEPKATVSKDSSAPEIRVVTNIDVSPWWAQQLKKIGADSQRTVVAPDHGAAQRAQCLADQLQLPVMYMNKQRIGTNGIGPEEPALRDDALHLLRVSADKFISHGLLQTARPEEPVGRHEACPEEATQSLSRRGYERNMPKIGSVADIAHDIAGRNIILIDDMVDTGTTAISALACLRKLGAGSVTACFTHAILSAGAYDRLMQAGFDRIMVSSTIASLAPTPGIERYDINPFLIEKLWNLCTAFHLSELLSASVTPAPNMQHSGTT